MGSLNWYKTTSNNANNYFNDNNIFAGRIALYFWCQLRAGGRVREGRKWPAGRQFETPALECVLHIIALTLTYISLLIIFCIIVYVTNKKKSLGSLPTRDAWYIATTFSWYFVFIGIGWYLNPVIYIGTHAIESVAWGWELPHTDFRCRVKAGYANSPCLPIEKLLGLKDTSVWVVLNYW